MRFLKKDKKYKVFQDGGTFTDSGNYNMAVAAGAMDFIDKKKQQK